MSDPVQVGEIRKLWQKVPKPWRDVPKPWQVAKTVESCSAPCRGTPDSANWSLTYRAVFLTKAAPRVRVNGWTRTDLLAGIERRPQPRDDPAAIRYEQLNKLWARRDIHVREKALWRMLYETAARANEILSLDISDLDPATRRATITAKGGHRQEVVWASGTARVLPRYLKGRQRGPVFVTHRRPRTPRPLSRHRAGPSLLPAGMGHLQGSQRLGPSRPPPRCAHPPRRSRCRSPATQRQEPPSDPKKPRPLPTTGYRGGSSTHRRTRPSPTLPDARRATSQRLVTTRSHPEYLIPKHPGAAA